MKRLNGIYTNNIKKQDIDYYEGTAWFKSKNQVETSEGKVLEAEHIVIASGSAPNTKVFKGNEHCWSSDDIFTMEEVPKSMIVLGGGYIGVEMAQIMHALGCKTTLLARSTLLRGYCDQELIPILTENMAKLGMECRLNSPHEGVEKLENGQLRVTLKDGSTLDADVVLSAVGRHPDVTPLKVENAGVALKASGAVIVDEYQNTNVPGIYAIGDVTEQATLTPVAIRQGRIVSERLFNNKPTLKMNYDNIATAVFSHPPIGSIGLSEDDAKAKWGEDKVKCYRSKFINMYYSPAATQEKKQTSLVKLVCHIEDDGTERVIGAFAIGKGVDEMMQGISVAVTMGASKQDFDNSVAIHPTASEEWVLMDQNIIQ